MDRTRFEHAVLVRTDELEPFTREFRDAGISVIPCLEVTSPLRFRRNFLRLLDDFGPFDALHAHGFSLLTTQTLLYARLRRIPLRIMHSHDDLRPKLEHLNAIYKLYVSGSLWLIRRLANARIACGTQAAEWVFGPGWNDHRKPLSLIIGVEMEPFFAASDPSLRERLNLPRGRYVVLQVARFESQKNHEFTVQIARELAERGFPFHLLLIGNGSLRPKIESQMTEAGLADRCTWLADTNQVPAILRSAVDLQLLPSIHEGLPLVIVEAQTAGVPILVSDTVTREAVIDPNLVDSLPIGQGAALWADRIIARLTSSGGRAITVAHREKMLATRFNLHRSVDDLARVYEDALSR